MNQEHPENEGVKEATGGNETGSVTEKITTVEGEAEVRDDAEAQMRRMSRRSFCWSVLAFGAGFTGLGWLNSRREEDGVPWPLRRVLQTNEAIARDLFSPARLAPTFPRSALTKARVNGDVGLGEDFDAANWTLNVEGLASGETLRLGLSDIKKLPRFEMITEFKCIEGWSTITGWAGVRLADFIAKYPPATRSGEAFNPNQPNDWLEYVGMATPDGAYYVGLEMPAAMHPQTLLAYEINGKPLSLEHGAPLRLVTPLKYGVKNLKRIGTIRYSDQRPADYWAERGYDWYAGH